ncbi:MAG: hypothetical protein JWM68_4207 [Verrucomicrobiales bacterium]|nr:hypothetical protein [Verrucomicrobiales bacterium]
MRICSRFLPISVELRVARERESPFPSRNAEFCSPKMVFRMGTRFRVLPKCVPGWETIGGLSASAFPAGKTISGSPFVYFPSGKRKIRSPKTDSHPGNQFRRGLYRCFGSETDLQSRGESIPFAESFLESGSVGVWRAFRPRLCSAVPVLKEAGSSLCPVQSAKRNRESRLFALHSKICIQEPNAAALQI